MAVCVWERTACTPYCSVPVGHVSRLLLHCITAEEESGDETSVSGGHMMVEMVATSD